MMLSFANLWIVFCLVAVEAWQIPSRSQPSSPKVDCNHFPQDACNVCSPSSRREIIQQGITSVAGACIAATSWGSSPSATNAATESTNAATNTGDFVSYTVEPFTFELPKSWKVIVNKKPNAATDGIAKKKATDGKLFSAMDFSTGAVVTVVEEKICSPVEYASNNVQCDIVASNGGTADALPFSSSITSLSKDFSKLLIRHDDRDNAALQGTTALDSVETVESSIKTTKASSWDVFATTTIPTGGTYRDGMGFDQPSMMTRTVQTKVVKSDDNSNSVMSLWLTAPTDEWGKPATGMKLRQSWKSISVL